MELFLEVLDKLFASFIAIGIWEWMRRPKYRWSCPIPGCVFKVSSPNDPGIVTYAADRHTEGVHQDG